MTLDRTARCANGTMQCTFLWLLALSCGCGASKASNESAEQDAGEARAVDAGEHDEASEPQADATMAADDNGPPSWLSLCPELAACDDGDLCTDDACVVDGCVHTAAPRASLCGVKCGPGERCGNGIVDPGEDCDDGNLANGDGCNRDCTVSGRVSPAVPLGIAAQIDEPSTIRVDGAGNLFVLAVFSTGSGQERVSDLRLVKVDAAGALVWEAGLGAQHEWRSYQLDLSEERAHVRGLRSSDRGLHAVEHVFTSDGATLRQVEHEVSADLADVQVMLAHEGRTYTAGSLEFLDTGGASRTNMLIQSLDEWGDSQWQLEVDRSPRDVPSLLVPLHDGRLAVGGTVRNNDDTQAWIGLISADGELLWDDVYPVGLSSRAKSIAYDAAGERLLLATQNFSWSDGLYFDVVQYDLTGSRTWSTRINDPDMWEELLEALIVDEEGNVVVGGWARSGTTTWLVAKWSREGAPLWTQVLHREQPAWAQAIATLDCGELVVLGGTYEPDTAFWRVTP